ncbi:hypothetical protein BC827DRAFT_1169751 [Russula dissimulans]|nr:hypothetical protein BC827DRAFT_1169751 [Russula dissimulans]
MRITSGFAAALALSQTVFGALYVTRPTSQTVCHAVQPCSVQWLDNGVVPLLGAMGLCRVALYSGNEKLIQQIEIVDVSTTQSLSFTPRPDAGPNSNTYYLAFTPIISSGPVTAFSATFSLDGMNGSFDSPIPELTSTRPVPSTLLLTHPNQIATSTHTGTDSLSTTTSSFHPSGSFSSSTSSLTATPSSRSNAAMRQSWQSLTVTLVGLSVSVLVYISKRL